MKKPLYVLLSAILGFTSCVDTIPPENEPDYTAPLAWDVRYEGMSLTRNDRVGNMLYIYTGEFIEEIPDTLSKINLDDGSLVWQAPLGGLFKSSALIDGIVYCFVENASYNILCFDDGTGELLARVSLDEDFDTAKALSIWIESLVS